MPDRNVICRRVARRPGRSASWMALPSALLLAVSIAGCQAAAQEARNLPRAAPDRTVMPVQRGGDALPPAESLEVMLNTGFEDATVGQPPRAANQQTDVLNVKLPSGQFAPIPIFYEGGNDSGRLAKVIPDPTASGNQVLQFWLKDAQVPGARRGRSKGRIQLAFSNFEFTAAHQRFRMYLHPDLAHYRSYPGENTWFTINELWFGERWRGDRHPFRITLTIAKEQGVGQPLRFAATGERAGQREGQWIALWHDVDPTFEVPVGEWIDVELGYVQGDAASGRLYVTMKRQSDARPVPVIDVRNWTYHPEAASPVPMTNWNPLKVYTSGAIIDHVRKEGGVVQVLFDDLMVRAAGSK